MINSKEWKWVGKKMKIDKGDNFMERVEPYKGIAGVYEEIRPSYPEELIQDIISKTDLKLSDSLLEIGAGTGKATKQFSDKGFKIHAIELGEDMAEILKDKCRDNPNVTVDVVSFEEWNLEDNKKYDVIYSAQAFHWIDKNIKYNKCYDLLKDNGYLVLFWYNACEDKLPLTKEIQHRIDRIVCRYVSNYSTNNEKPERREHDGIKQDDRKTEIEASGLFELIDEIEYIYETKSDANQYLKVMKSVPAFASILDGLEDKIINEMNNEIIQVINEYGGYVGTLFKFSLYIARKRTSSYK